MGDTVYIFFNDGYEKTIKKNYKPEGTFSIKGLRLTDLYQ